MISAGASFLRYGTRSRTGRSSTKAARPADSGVHGIGLVAPDGDLALVLACLHDVVRSLHAHERVMFTPNAFSMRRAISPDRSAFWFRRFDSAGRDPPSTFAAAVTESPCAPMISVLMNSPG